MSAKDVVAAAAGEVGYLVGTMEKWNNAKKSEERDRVKHGLTGPSAGSNEKTHG